MVHKEKSKGMVRVKKTKYFFLMVESCVSEELNSLVTGGNEVDVLGVQLKEAFSEAPMGR